MSPEFSNLPGLYELLKKGSCWEWMTEREEAFQHSKKLLQSANILVHYSADKELVLACDASPYEVGCVFPQIRKLKRTTNKFNVTHAVRRREKLDKEGLAVVWNTEVPQIPVKEALYYLHRSQIIDTL